VTTTSREPRAGTGEAPEDIKAVPVRHPGRWVAVAVLAVLIAMLINNVVSNPNYRWDTVGKYVFDRRLSAAALVTLQLTVLSMFFGVVLAVLLAVMRLSRNPILTSSAWVYLWVFRGTPVYTQLVFWGLISVLYPQVGIGIPFGPEFASFQTTEVITFFVAALIGLALNEAAYMAEIVRGGILSVDRGQVDASLALGMSRALAMRRIILPQALRVIVPPAGNQFISLLKATSLVSVIAGGDLLTAAENIASANLHTIELMLVATFWYLVLTTITSVAQHFAERRLARGSLALHGRP